MTRERTPEQRHQLAVIGAALMAPEACRDSVERLTPEMFEEGPLRRMFGALRLRLTTGNTLDTLILEKLVGADCHSLILEAAETVPTLSHVEDYEALVLEDYRRRLLLELAGRVSMSAEDADGICRELNAALKQQDALRRESVDAHVKEFSEVWGEAMAWLEQPDTNARLCWKEIDRFGLFGQGMVTVLAGRPGQGKTDLALALAFTLSKTWRVYYLTMEEDRRKLMLRTMSKVARINSSRMRDRNLTDEERACLNSVYTGLKHHTNLIYDDGTRMTVETIRARVQQFKPRIVFVDHIGLIADTVPSRKEVERLSDITRELKTLALETGITIVELVQVNRATDRNGGMKKASLGDLRGSGTIEQDADAVVFIENEVNGERRLQGPNDYFEVSLRVSKNREGETGRVPMWWQPQYHEWQPAPDPSEDFTEEENAPLPAGW